MEYFKPKETENMEKPEKIERLKAKYGFEKLRRAIAYDTANIPERLWFKKSETEIVHELLESNCDVIVIESMNSDFSSKVVADVLRYLIRNKNNRVLFLDFFASMNTLVSTFGTNNLEMKELEKLDSYDVIAFTNIYCGQIYDKYADVFPLIVMRLINSTMEKKVILTLDAVKEKERENAYGNLYSVIVANEYETYLIDGDGNLESTEWK